MVWRDPPPGVWELAVRPAQVSENREVKLGASHSARYRVDGRYEITIVADKED